MNGHDTFKLLDGTPELIPLISSEIESEFFLKGYDICVSPSGSTGKEISITRHGEFRRFFGNMTAFKIRVIPDDGRIRFKTSVGLYGNKEIPATWSTFLMPLTRNLFISTNLTRRHLP